MDDESKAQLESASDAVKQVVTLSTGILTITLTFAKTLASGASSGWQTALRWSWALLGVAIIAGIWFMLAKAGVVYENKSISIKDWRLRGPWLIELSFFVVAIIIIFLFGITQFGDIPPPSSSSP